MKNRFNLKRVIIISILFCFLIGLVYVVLSFFYENIYAVCQAKGYLSGGLSTQQCSIIGLFQYLVSTIGLYLFIFFVPVGIIGVLLLVGIIYIFWKKL